jgi:hypothetical protein
MEPVVLIIYNNDLHSSRETVKKIQNQIKHNSKVDQNNVYEIQLNLFSHIFLINVTQINTIKLLENVSDTIIISIDSIDSILCDWFYCTELSDYKSKKEKYTSNYVYLIPHIYCNIQCNVSNRTRIPTKFACFLDNKNLDIPNEFSGYPICYEPPNNVDTIPIVFEYTMVIACISMCLPFKYVRLNNDCTELPQGMFQENEDSIIKNYRRYALKLYELKNMYNLQDDIDIPEKKRVLAPVYLCKFIMASRIHLCKGMTIKYLNLHSTSYNRLASSSIMSIYKNKLSDHVINTLFKRIVLILTEDTCSKFDYLLNSFIQVPFEDMLQSIICEYYNKYKISINGIHLEDFVFCSEIFRTPFIDFDVSSTFSNQKEFLLSMQNIPFKKEWAGIVKDSNKLVDIDPQSISTCKELIVYTEYDLETVKDLFKNTTTIHLIDIENTQLTVSFNRFLEKYNLVYINQKGTCKELIVPRNTWVENVTFCKDCIVNSEKNIFINILDEHESPSTLVLECKRNNIPIIISRTGKTEILFGKNYHLFLSCDENNINWVYENSKLLERYNIDLFINKQLTSFVP